MNAFSKYIAEIIGWFFDGLDALNFDTRTTGSINVEFQGCTPNPDGFLNTPGGQISGKQHNKNKASAYSLCQLGQIFLPDFNQCMGVPDDVLLTIAKVNCSTINDATQPPITWVFDNGQITWVIIILYHAIS